MPGLIAPRDLGPVAAMAATALVVLAVFAWTERTVLVDPDHQSVPYWPWKLWQVPPLLMGIGGAWWLWAGTNRVTWVRSLALGLLGLAVLVNGYTDAFGDHTGDAWRTLNPLFLGAASVAAVTLWRCGSGFARACAVISAGLGVVVFLNAYFLNEGSLWPALNPLRMLAFVAWAAAAGQPASAQPKA